MLHGSAIRRALSGALFGIAVVAGACDGPQSDPAVPLSGPTLSASVADSLAREKRSGSASTDRGSTSFNLQSASSQSTGIPVRAGSKVTLKVTYVDTGRCETVTISGPVSGTISGLGNCSGSGTSDGVGQTMTLGPADSDGTVTFKLTTGTSAISGSHPNYTVYLGDDVGDDMDDVVLSVTIEEECTHFGDDPVANDESVQEGFKELWEDSNADDNLAKRNEVGAWIVQTESGYKLEPWGVKFPACGGDIELQIPENVVGFVHTHPYASGELVYTCDESGRISGFTEYPGTPSDIDRATAEALGEALGRDGPLPGYIIDKDGIVRFEGLDETADAKSKRCGY